MYGTQVFEITDLEKRRPEQSSGPPQHSKYTGFSWALDAPIISLNKALFEVWLLD